MSNNPLVSVVIPAYNHENYIQETIKSIINQTYKNIELVIVDDGSKDSTWQKILDMKEDCEKRFSNVCFETKENEGTCKTLNHLLELAKGDYIYLIASDDVSYPEAIESELEFLNNNKDYDLCVGNCEFIDTDSKRCFWDINGNYKEKFEQNCFETFADYFQTHLTFKFMSNKFGTYETLYLGNYIPNGYLIRKSAFNYILPFTPEAPLEDYYIMLQIAKYSKMKYIDKILFSYRQHKTNTINNKNKMLDMTNKTLLHEEDILKTVDKTKVKNNVIDTIKYGAVIKRKGIPFIFEKIKRRKYNKEIKEIKLFNIIIYKKEKEL